jgi:hypothetical protein
MCRHHKKKGCGIYSGVHDGVDTAKCDGRNPDNWCYVEPVMEKQKRARKEPEETPDERLAAEGDTDKLRKTLEKKDGSKLPEQPVSSLFSLDYMKDIARAMKGAATVSVHAGQDHPIRFDFEIAGIEASFLVAPRIETDGGAE